MFVWSFSWICISHIRVQSLSPLCQMESATPWVQALWAKNWQSKHLTHTYFCIVVCKVCQAQNAYIFINRGVQILLVIGLYGLYACLLGFPYFAPFQTADFLYVFFSFLSSSASACFPDVPEDSWTSHLPCPTESLSWSNEQASDAPLSCCHRN